MDGAGGLLRRPLRLLWVALTVQLLGRLLDLRWHATHDEFEGPSQQFEAHWLLWIGVLGTLVVVGWLVAQGASPGRSGYLTALVASCLYVAVAVWHFVEHANHQDPELAHILLAVTQTAVVAGAVLATVAVRRAQARPAGESGQA